MNRAWLIRAESRIEQLEAKIRTLSAELEAFRNWKAAMSTPAEPAPEQDTTASVPVKRGPGRPPKVSND